MGGSLKQLIIAVADDPRAVGGVLQESLRRLDLVVCVALGVEDQRIRVCDVALLAEYRGIFDDALIIRKDVAAKPQIILPAAEPAAFQDKPAGRERLVAAHYVRDYEIVGIDSLTKVEDLIGVAAVVGLKIYFVGAVYSLAFVAAERRCFHDSVVVVVVIEQIDLAHGGASFIGK